MASKATSNASRKCPCGSGQLYPACCGRYHTGAAAAPTPEAQLRARFSAYSMQLIDYLVATTHPENPEHTGDPLTYAKSVQRTARITEFLGLKVLGAPDADQPAAAAATASEAQATSGLDSSSSSRSDEDAYLKFTVRWRERGLGGPEGLATEVSHFKRVNGAWLYYAAVQ
ncbi:hypothetical protein OEZ85_000398 [Tetradesmus obliquus]|uniref:YchJ-like middle NTF2-like domain-containing protein n=1 Tax=Tetradesmus obliquus TaxID=3088 RepID=A0ABY8UQJ4_TETOB|nr:hypothetical protein OEZ85_000398 [Tetradesmus obliquus]